MKPEVKKLVSAFQATAQSVKIRLKQNGFVLPVSHNGGIKFIHCYIKKDRRGWYNILNLHNPKISYYKGIANHKIAVAISIYLGMDVGFDEQEHLDADHKYLHYYNEIRFLKHGLKIAEQNNEDFKIDMYNARLHEYMPKYEKYKHTVGLLLDEAETLLFDTK